MEPQLNKEIIKIAFDIQKHLIPDSLGKYQSPPPPKMATQIIPDDRPLSFNASSRALLARID